MPIPLLHMMRLDKNHAVASLDSLDQMKDIINRWVTTP
eukprot:gene830-666_t